MDHAAAFDGFFFRGGRDREQFERYREWERQQPYWSLDYTPSSSYSDFEDYQEWRRWKENKGGPVYRYADVEEVTVVKSTETVCNTMILLPKKPIDNPYAFEIQLSGVITEGFVLDTGGYVVSRSMEGMRGSISYQFAKHVSFGLEIERQEAHDIRGLDLSYLKHESIAAVVRGRLLGPIYFIGGIGRGKYKSEFELNDRNLSGSSLIYIVGFGAEVHIYKGLYLVGEWRLSIDNDRWENFVFEGPERRRELNLGLSYRFGKTRFDKK